MRESGLIDRAWWLLSAVSVAVCVCVMQLTMQEFRREQAVSRVLLEEQVRLLERLVEERERGPAAGERLLPGWRPSGLGEPLGERLGDGDVDGG